MVQFIAAFLLFGLGAFLGGMLHDDLWRGPGKASAASRLMVIPLLPWWVGLTLVFYGPRDAFLAARNMVLLAIYGDYDADA